MYVSIGWGKTRFTVYVKNDLFLYYLLIIVFFPYKQL